MHKVKIVAENYADTGRLTANPAVSMDLENLKSQSISKIIRTNITGPAQQEISLSIVPIRTISAIVLGRHNFPLNMTLQFILKDSGGGILHTSPLLTVQADEVGERNIPWDSYLWDTTASNIDDVAEEFDPKANYVYWVEEDAGDATVLYDSMTGEYLLDTVSLEPLWETGGSYGAGFTGIDNVATIQILIDVPINKQIEIGRLIVGEYISPVYNVSFNHKIEWKETSKQYRTEAATLRSDIGNPVRKIDFQLELINDEDRTELQAGLRYVGLRRDFYIDIFPTSTSVDKQRDYSGIMKLTQEPVMSEYANLYYKSKYIMEEV